jgi:hypothetical protein
MASRALSVQTGNCDDLQFNVVVRRQSARNADSGWVARQLINRLSETISASSGRLDCPSVDWLLVVLTGVA